MSNKHDDNQRLIETMNSPLIHLFRSWCTRSERSASDLSDLEFMTLWMSVLYSMRITIVILSECFFDFFVKIDAFGQNYLLIYYNVPGYTTIVRLLNYN